MPRSPRNDDQRWIVRCVHKDYFGQTVDFGELSQGAPESKAGRSHLWRGGFSGRPELAEELIEAIRLHCATGTMPYIHRVLHSMRTFYRFLDSYEKVVNAEAAEPARIVHLHQVSGALIELASQPGPGGAWRPCNSSVMSAIRAVISRAVDHHELPDLSWGSIRRPRPTPRDTPTEEEGLAIIRFLRTKVLGMLRRWQRADLLASQGRDLSLLFNEGGHTACRQAKPNEADAHATFRALMRTTDNPLPLATDFYAAFRSGGVFPAWWPRHPPTWDTEWMPPFHAWSELAQGVYPSSEDVATCALLCLARSAWNPSTLLSLDIDDWFSNFDSENAWVFASKDRSRGSLQYTISPRAHQSGVYRIVSTLIDRTKPLRGLLWADSALSKRAEIGKRSPWIGLSMKPAETLYVADPREIRTLNNWLKRLVEECNKNLGPEAQVRHITASDFRDIAAASTFRRSNYSMLMLMVLLGHKTISSGRSYGMKKSSREESHGLVIKVVQDIFEQSRANQAWDPTLTRAAVEGVDASEEARKRLDDYRAMRTYSGAVCTDPFHPPVEIDPNHLGDGRSLCVQGHMCIAKACPRATVLNDSLDDICKTIAELEWRELNTPAVRFQISSAVSDLETLRLTAQQWPAAEVEARRSHWRRLIDDGSHRPLLWAGQH